MMCEFAIASYLLNVLAVVNVPQPSDCDWKSSEFAE